jgi:hypothetical protein
MKFTEKIEKELIYSNNQKISPCNFDVEKNSLCVSNQIKLVLFKVKIFITLKHKL